jgi:trans-2,3-dihydro-3-hydroxyanthranilate isomerase
MARRFPFVQFDVFTSRPLEGNPLAVFTDARGLSQAEMQALAREMNLSETTFVLPRDPEVERCKGVQVRIFTVEEELRFAGHPTLGTAYYVHCQSGGNEVWLDLPVGKIQVSFSTDDRGRTFGEMRQMDPQFGATHAREEVARATGFSVEQLDTTLPIQTVSTGLPFTIVPLRSLEAARSLRLDWSRAADYLKRSQGGFFYFVTRETSDRTAQLHARMIFYNGEDPATGSAAGCAAAWMVKYAVAEPEQRALIEQGVEAQRPSHIFVRAARAGERIVNVRVGGHVVEVLRGEVSLPEVAL